MSRRTRLRWTGEEWLPAPPRAVVKQIQKTPEKIAAEITKMILDAQLTDVVMLGERVPGGQAKAFCYMSSHRMLWYSEMLRFRAMHGRFPHETSRHGGPV